MRAVIIIMAIILLIWGLVASRQQKVSKCRWSGTIETPLIPSRTLSNK